MTEQEPTYEEATAMLLNAGIVSKELFESDGIYCPDDEFRKRVKKILKQQFKVDYATLDSDQLLARARTWGSHI